MNGIIKKLRDITRISASALFLMLFCVSYTITVHSTVVDQPPGEFQLPYSPADGDTVSVNPPPFIWVPSEDAGSYTLELSRDPGFTASEIITEPTDITTAALTKILAPGVWFWRYGVTLKSGRMVKSRARKFIVPANARKMPFPSLPGVIRSIPREHPRLFVPRRDIDDLRQRVASSRQSDLKSLLNESSGYFGEEIVPEPPYVTGEGPERGRNFMKIFRSTRPPMDRMETCALAYLMTGEKAHGEEAKRRILHFFSWDPEGPTSYRNNDEPAMWVMMRGVRAYDWTYDLFTAQERLQVEKSMRIRARQFYDHLKFRRRFHTNPFESHAGRTLGFLGEVSLAFIHEWPEAREYLEYVLTLFWNVYPAWGKEDGGWHEGPSYWSYYMSFALHFVVPLRQLTGIDLMEKPFFRNTPYFKLYTNPPYARISPFGDGEHDGPNRSMGELMYWFGSLLNEPRFIRYAGEKHAGPGNRIIGLLLGRDDIKGKKPGDIPPCRNFPGVGLVSMHTALGNAQNDVHLLFHSDPYGAISHSHADQNAFTVEAFGEALAIASGYYPWYGSEHHKNWQWHSKSSNTITFDGGEGQVIRNRASRGRIIAFEQNGHFDYTLGDATEAYGGRLDLCQRHVLHLRKGIFLIHDEIESPEPRRFEWRLHALEKMDIDDEKGIVTVKRGKARMRVVFLNPERLEFTQTDRIQWPPEDDSPPQWPLTASTEKPVSS